VLGYLQMEQTPVRGARTRVFSTVFAAITTMIALAIAGCGGKSVSKPTPETKPADNKDVGAGKQIKPYTLAPKNRALIYGTDRSGGSTVIPLLGKKNTQTVDVMAVFARPGNARGMLSPTRLTTEPQTVREINVGVVETHSGGTGATWRSAVWLAAFVSATILNKDLTDFSYLARSSGFIDGPSAGALTTVGFLASITGATVDPKATMTGTINPDGTVGPVGGIVHKINAAIAKGKKRIGFPIGRRYDRDMNTRKRVDLVELARKQGATAVEISDVWQAYEFLTGKKLPTPVPVEPKAMALEPSVEKNLERLYKEWRKRLAAEFALILRIKRLGELQGGLRTMASLAEHEATGAEKLLRQGVYASAYYRVIKATVFASATVATWQIMEKVKQGDVAGARQTLRAFASLSQKIEPTLRKIGKLRPGTMGGHMLMVSAFQQAVAGWGFHVVGTTAMQNADKYLARLRRVPPAQQKAALGLVARAVAPALLNVAHGMARTRMATETMELEKSSSDNYTCSLPNARRLALSYSSASVANLKYFESLFVTRAAKQLKISDDVARIRFMKREPDYLISFKAVHLSARAFSGLPEKLKKAWGDKSLPWSLSTLAAGILSYFKSSLLISKWSSLGVKVNRVSGTVTEVRMKKAFIHMLTMAERKARERAHEAKLASGSIPIQARLHYQNAKVLRDGSLNDKFKALELFWASTMYSQTAVMLARN